MVIELYRWDIFLAADTLHLLSSIDHLLESVEQLQVFNRDLDHSIILVLILIEIL